MGCVTSSQVHVKFHAHAGPRPGMAPPAPLPQAPAAKPAMGTVMVQVPRGARPGQLLQMTTPHGQKIQCPVPAGLAPGAAFQVQYPIPVGPTGPTIIDENEKLASRNAIAAHMLPSYWTNVKVPENDAFDQMIYVDREQHDKFNELLDLTYRAKATQDRKCPKKAGPCPKTAGGCPCVQPGAMPGMPCGFKVRRVVRVEDSEMWGRYASKRDAIHERRVGDGETTIEPLDPPAVSNEVAEKHSQTFEPLDLSLNEMYLWHGTNVRAALSIAQSDFRIDLAGSSTGTMYGLGAYFAEHCTKADEYASDEPGGYYDGVFAMLLCRVCLGKFYYTQVRDTEAGAQVQRGTFDSTVGDRLTKADTFREFVIYDADAIYPEYVVLYTRVHTADPDEKVERLTKDLYHLQLPVYWANCHKDPLKNPFHEHVLLRQYTVNLLQELVGACFKGTGTVEVVSAKRVENSVVWQKYVQCKRSLESELRSKRVKTAKELDETHGDILTNSFLKSRDSTEECVSITNLEEPLNEHLLWHGTTKEAAEKIAQSDFKIPVGKDMKHAARFGNGAYLAEDLEKSLTYADAAPNGNRCVLLCRTLCGDFWYTEDHTRIDASQQRDAAKKHSVLANPERQGPREFIVPNADQVYPEFILELKVSGWTPPAPARMKKTKMQVDVPPGVYPGQYIIIKAPDGRELKVVVPPGAIPGTKIEIEA
mmetsp:Transcript_42044/g.97966  ORF Transcript_42044/g.97966 Transcript_42044/m.97966 type:complete len:704 (-) Transcript_42044:114-2225(-)